MSRNYERDALILQLREGGKTFREIGDLIGVSVKRASDLYFRVRFSSPPPDMTRCSLCGAERGRPHVKLWRGVERARPVDPADLGHGVFDTASIQA